MCIHIYIYTYLHIYYNHVCVYIYIYFYFYISKIIHIQSLPSDLTRIGWNDVRHDAGVENVPDLLEELVLEGLVNVLFWSFFQNHIQDLSSNLEMIYPRLDIQLGLVRTFASPRFFSGRKHPTNFGIQDSTN